MEFPESGVDSVYVDGGVDGDCHQRGRASRALQGCLTDPTVTPESYAPRTWQPATHLGPNTLWRESPTCSERRRPGSLGRKLPSSWSGRRSKTLPPVSRSGTDFGPHSLPGRQRTALPTASSGSLPKRCSRFATARRPQFSRGRVPSTKVLVFLGLRINDEGKVARGARADTL